MAKQPIIYHLFLIRSNTMNLKVQLYAKGSTVYFRVLEQPEAIRGKYGFANTFVTSTGLEIASYDGPELAYEEIFIRGTDGREDIDLVELDFDSPELAADYVSRATVALREFCAATFVEEEPEAEGVMSFEFKKG